MKNRKWVLGIILFLIVAVLAFMYYVMATGSNMYKKERNYIMVLENAACDYIQDNNITQSRWKNESQWQKISIGQLIDENYLNNEYINPVTNKNIGEYRDKYVNIVFDNNKMYCKYNEE